MRARTSTKEHSVLYMKLSEVLWLLVIILLLFQPALQHSFPVMARLDELVSCLLAVCAISQNNRKASILPRSIKASLLCLIAFSVVCLIGNVVSGIPDAVSPILIDAFTCVKFFVATVSAMLVFSKGSRTADGAVFVAKALLLLLGVCALLSLVTDIGMSYSEVRYGIRPFEFVFPHPTYLAVALAGVVILLSADAKSNRGWIVLAAAVMALTLRGKAMGFAALVLLILLFSNSGRKRVGPFQIVSLGLVALVIGWGQIEAYFGTEGQARSELLHAGLQIATDHFPLGAGFASFGSAITAEPNWYSPLYIQYGLSSIWGLSQDYPAFISDSFWPTVLGQSGMAGLVLYSCSLFLLFRGMLRRTSSKLPVLMFIAYLLIMSTSESSFFGPSSVYLAICVAVASCQRLRGFNENNEPVELNRILA